MQRAVIYARFSSDMQREESIDAQVCACKTYSKGERINDYGIDKIARIDERCNNLPRKILECKTPDEWFEAKLDEIYSV